MDSQRDSINQIEHIVSLVQDWQMDDVQRFYDPNFNFMNDSKWLPQPEPKRK